MVMAHPYLPAEYLKPAFHKLAEKATMRTSSIYVTILKPLSYTAASGLWKLVCVQQIHTHQHSNNDVEGWHQRHQRDGSPPLFSWYHYCTWRLSIKVRLLGEGTKNKLLSGKIFKIWDEYSVKSISTRKLLRNLLT